MSVATIELCQGEILRLRRPSLIDKKREPFWKFPDLNKLMAGIRFEDQVKIYKSMYISIASIYAYEITFETHTIDLFIKYGESQKIQFEDNESFDEAVELLSRINLKQ